MEAITWWLIDYLERDVAGRRLLHDCQSIRIWLIWFTCTAIGRKHLKSLRWDGQEWHRQVGRDRRQLSIPRWEKKPLLMKLLLFSLASSDTPAQSDRKTAQGLVMGTVDLDSVADNRTRSTTSGATDHRTSRHHRARPYTCGWDIRDAKWRLQSQAFSVSLILNLLVIADRIGGDRTSHGKLSCDGDGDSVQ